MTLEELERIIPTLPGLASAMSCVNCVFTNSYTQEKHNLIDNTHLCALYLYLVKNMKTVPVEEFEISFRISSADSIDDYQKITITSYGRNNLKETDLFKANFKNPEHKNLMMHYKENVINPLNKQQRGWSICSIQDTSSDDQSAHDFVQRVKFFNDLPPITYN
jgi:hypothetical protein